MNNHLDPLHLPPLVSADWLAAHSDDVVVADVRWYLDGRPARPVYEAGHIAGAIFIDLDVDLSDRTEPATMGRHPLPSPERFAAAMCRLGIGDNTPVVAYDDTGGSTAGRLVVMLRCLGRSAAMLDGGMKVWTDPLDVGAAIVPQPAVFTTQPWPTDRFVSTDEVAAASTRPSANRVVLDARAGDRFRGEFEPIDPRPGHIPGATNAPWSDNLDGVTGRFRSPEELRARYESLGVSDDVDVVCYCGSGVTTCANVLAIEHAGFAPPRLFVPSWSGWSNDPTRPAALGDA